MTPIRLLLVALLLLMASHRPHFTRPLIAPDPAFAPFLHGVASGDPLPDRVILWTRVTPPVGTSSVEIQWEIAHDPAMQQILATGTVTTHAERDFTVKVDADGLESGTSYYYRFLAYGQASLVGRTRTAPKGHAEHLRFAVVSCAKYQDGYFNAYARIAERADLDAVIHLGDYIYEHSFQAAGVELDHETVTLTDYRSRYAAYRLDPALRQLHQQHPMIAIWDDHEVADDAHSTGAENHQPEAEGDWHERKRQARQAYFEWMPVREAEPGPEGRIYRHLPYGDLAEIVLLDTRLEERDAQGKGDKATRTLLGQAQSDWLQTTMAEATAQWKVVANQVMMMPLRGFSNNDAWDGYPADRNRLFQTIRREQLENVVVLTGDIHSSWAGDLADRQGFVGAEFVTPSISSDNLDERTGMPSDGAEWLLRRLNGHLKAVDLDEHGYFVLDLTPAHAQADWFFVETIREASANERHAMSWRLRSGERGIERVRTPAPGKSAPPSLAPEAPLPLAPEAPLPLAPAPLILADALNSENS